jgi:hypothetical protein
MSTQRSPAHFCAQNARPAPHPKPHGVKITAQNGWREGRDHGAPAEIRMEQTWPEDQAANRAQITLDGALGTASLARSRLVTAAEPRVTRSGHFGRWRAT